MSDTNQHVGGPARRAAAAAALRAAEAKDKRLNAVAERKPDADPKARPDWVWEARMDEACAPVRECGQTPPTRSHSPEPCRTMPWTYYALLGAWTYCVLWHSTSMAGAYRR